MARAQPAGPVFGWLVRLRWLAIVGIVLVLVGVGNRLSSWALGTLAGLVLTLVVSSLLTHYLTGKHQSERRPAGSVDDPSLESDRLRDAREELETERSRLQAIIDCMGDAVSFSDRAGNVLLENQRAAQLWGAPGAADATRADVLKATLEGATGARVFEHAGRSYEATSSVVRDQRERSMGLVVVARDVTDRLALERRLAHEEQISVVGKLAAVVAHEINNPIGVVSLYAQHALARLPKGDPLQRHLETIQRNAESCRKITGDLLELARPRKPKHERVDLRTVCHDVAQSVEPLAAKLGVRIIHEESASAVWAEADAQQLRQAVLNLTLNAIEASRQGGTVQLRAFEAPELAPITRAIEISDCGEGIPAEELERIFQPFFTTKPTGTGLGLAVADNIVRGHGGSISVESETRQGTTFRVLLPEVPPSRGLPSVGDDPA
ncbi:MAG: hypothetical protein HS104_30370 [Polyangiaceae bacterium]|nr:hypothetical protein [Polyangiaceae bacterium]MCL4755609.1 hypothetical protein [Myxococcales bacterium]